MWTAAISPQHHDFLLNKPSAVNETALLTGHGGVASGLVLCCKKFVQGKGRKDTNILGLHLSKIWGLEHFLHGEGGKLCCVALINYSTVTSLQSEHLFLNSFLDMNIRSCQTVRMAEFNTFFFCWKHSRLKSVKWAPPGLPYGSISEPRIILQNRSTGGTQILNECPGLTALFVLMP